MLGFGNMKTNRERKRIEGIVSKFVKNYLEEEKNKSFSIDDYWDLPSLSDEQIQSLYTDLLVFVCGNAYGDKLQCVDNKVEVFEAIEKHTCDYNEVKQELKTKFDFQDWQIKEEHGANNIKLVLLFSPVNQNSQIIIKEMEILGWTKSYITPVSFVKGIPVIAISFGPLYQPSIKDTVRQWTFLLHLTPLYNKESILRNGLIPSSQNSRFDYPPRLHFLKPTIPITEFENIKRQLSQANNNLRNNGEYCLFRIDLSKVPDNVEFYFDPRYEYGIYTKQAIPSNAIICINTTKVI